MRLRKSLLFCSQPFEIWNLFAWELIRTVESVSGAGSETPKRRSVLNKEAKRLLSHYLIFRGSKLTSCWLCQEQNMVRNCVALISWLQLKFVFVVLALKCLKIQTFRDYCPFISGRCRYTERASFYSNVATFEARAGRVRSNKIEVHVYAARL